MKNLNVLCLHGIGAKEDQPEFNEWMGVWTNYIREKTNENAIVDFLEFDEFFSKQKATFGDYFSFLKDAIIGTSRLEKGKIKDFKEDYLDMIVEFFKYDSVSLNLRKHLKEKLSKKKYDIIYAHSLGSIICYDFFISENINPAYNNITLITSGSQLGHSNLPRFQPLQSLNVKAWYNLNNRFDRVLANKTVGNGINRCQDIKTHFWEGLFKLSHDGGKYLLKSDPELWKNIERSYNYR
ncbi:hypothetical protein [Sphingobacterium sp.]|uniref:hypothetical protein n=1 Tax=Sphingobacterium sp. TaxID=341027 RepID=UPI0031D1D9BA